MGLQAVLLTRMRGASLIVAVDPSAEARAAALIAGADRAVDPATDDPAKALFELTGGRRWHWNASAGPNRWSWECGRSLRGASRDRRGGA